MLPFCSIEIFRIPPVELKSPKPSLQQKRSTLFFPQASFIYFGRRCETDGKYSPLYLYLLQFAFQMYKIARRIAPPQSLIVIIISQWEKEKKKGNRVQSRKRANRGLRTVVPSWPKNKSILLILSLLFPTFL